MTAACRWHLPRFERALCESMSDRERLGLPAHHVDFALEEAVARQTRCLRATEVQGLLGTVADARAPLAARIAAGNLLALAGDPRVRVLEPDMVDVPGGDIETGLPDADVAAVLERCAGLALDAGWIAKECPRHRVRLRPFRLARHPVTNLEYREFLRDTGHDDLPSSWRFGRYPHELANHPVHGVQAASADAYAGWLAHRTGRAFRLPAEAEWEWAAAGPEGREFPWGNEFDPARANTAETGLLCTTPVGVFVDGQSCFGILDLAGNVEEYTADDYAAYPGGYRVDDHLHRLNGSYRVARGGSFARFRDLARTRRRHGPNARSAAYAMGLRVAESAQGEKTCPTS